MDPLGDSARRTIAWFETSADVRNAQIDLERNGIDAVHLTVSVARTPGERNRADARAGGWAARRGLMGAVLGALVGAVAGLAIGWLLFTAGADRALFALGGAILGVAAGASYAVATRLPADSDAFDTFATDTPGDTWIAVTGPPELRRKATAIMAANRPVRLVEPQL